MSFQKFIYLCPANEPTACGLCDTEMVEYVMVSSAHDVAVLPGISFLYMMPAWRKSEYIEVSGILFSVNFYSCLI